jgi:hypothetical protein
MSDRMPEDLPVTKLVDVMVGITRSNVFFLNGALPNMRTTYGLTILKNVHSWPTMYRIPSCGPLK